MFDTDAPFFRPLLLVNEWLLRAARGLARLHALNPPIAHGNMKLEGDIIQDSLEGRICDFGTSKIVAAVSHGSGCTTAEAILGNLGFRAQEVLQDEPATTASDVYAFGGLLFFVCFLYPFMINVDRQTHPSCYERYGSVGYASCGGCDGRYHWQDWEPCQPSSNACV